MTVHDSIILRGVFLVGKARLARTDGGLATDWTRVFVGASRRTTTTTDVDGDGAGDGGDDRSRGCRRGGGVRRRCGMRDDDDARWTDE